MKKGMVLLTGFLLAFSIFLVGCGNKKMIYKLQIPMIKVISKKKKKLK